LIEFFNILPQLPKHPVHLGCFFHRLNIALAETYHTMISNQPYQAARSHWEALAELERRAGNQFDPALIPLFRDVLKSRQEETGMLLQTGRPDSLLQV
jgi:HD-GYP domain-containing protein (c-di-GMP phosphodiesterase class II)